MAKKVPSNNGVTLDQVTVVFDPLTNSVKIHCQDEELATGFVLGVQKNGRLENDLLRLLASHGVINMAGAETVTPHLVSAPTTPEPETVAEPAKPTLPKLTPKPAPAEPEVPQGIEAMEPDRSNKFVIPEHLDIPKIDLTRTGNLISVMSPKERTSKSTTAVMLGASLVRLQEFHNLDNDKKVVIIDFDLRNQSVTSLTSARSVGGSLGVYDSGAITTESLNANMFYNEELGVHVLPVGSSRSNPINYLGDQFLEETIKVLREEFAVIIVDTPDIDVTYSQHWLVNESDIIFLNSAYNRSTEFDWKDWSRSHIKYKKTLDKITVLLAATPKLQLMAALEDVKKIFSPLSIIGNTPVDTAVFLAATRNETLATTFKSNNMVASAYLTIASRLLP